MNDKNKVILVSNAPEHIARRNSLKSAGKVALSATVAGTVVGLAVYNMPGNSNAEQDNVIDTKQELFTSPSIWDSYNSEESTVVYKDKNGTEVIVPVGVVAIGQDGNTLFEAAGSAVAYGAVNDQETVTNEFVAQNEGESLVHDGDSFIYETQPQELPAGQ